MISLEDGFVQQMVDVEQMVCCQIFFWFLVAICRATGMDIVRFFTTAL